MLQDLSVERVIYFVGKEEPGGGRNRVDLLCLTCLGSIKKGLGLGFDGGFWAWVDWIRFGGFRFVYLLGIVTKNDPFGLSILERHKC